MLALAYLVKHCTVNAKNRVRNPESTKVIMNMGLRMLNDEVEKKE